MVVVPLPCDQEREVEREGGGERRTSSHAMFKHSFHRAIPHGWPRDTRHQMKQHLTGALAENGISLWDDLLGTVAAEPRSISLEQWSWCCWVGT